jgi:hypothetical protein
MNLYSRDYTKIITQEETDAQKLHKIWLEPMKIRGSTDTPMFTHPDFEVRKFLWNHNSLFPNNCLCRFELEELDFTLEADRLSEILDAAKTETDVQSYIKNNRKWFIPGSILKDYNFGHHGAYLFLEQKLGIEYIADYILLGENSDGHSIVLVEFEKPNSPFLITTSNSESESVRKGLTQIKDWKRWIDDNREYFFNSMGLKGKGVSIPVSRFFYCLVVSRRKHMDERTRDVRSQICFEMQNTKIISFDRLVDNTKRLFSNGCYSW